MSKMAREWTPLYFGRHKGKTLPWVIFHDPDWFFWAYKNGIFKDKQTLRKEVREIYRKSRSIRIPQKRSERQIAEYGFSNRKGRFVNLEIVPVNQPQHEGSTPVYRLPVIDLSVPGDTRSYDKLGYRILLKAVKFVLFRNSKCRMTEKRCASFFNNDSNFDFSNPLMLE